jgi:FkbM family methyltransferase
MQVGPLGSVAAFEPDPMAFCRLRYHVRKNRLSQVLLFNAAVSDNAKPLRLSRSSYWGSSQSYVSDDGELTIDAVVPDELVAKRKIRLPDFIKIDIEGHAHAALKGSRRSIEQSRPVVLFNCHSRDEIDGARAVFESLNYRRLDFSGKAIGWGDLDPASILLP